MLQWHTTDGSWEHRAYWGTNKIDWGADKSPSRLLQLAVSKEGIIGGTLYNTEGKEAVSIQGSVVKKTQRACWTAGDKKTTVMEAGVYNLTQDETPVLVHFGSGKTQEFLLVRLEQNEAPQQ